MTIGSRLAAAALSAGAAGSLALAVDDIDIRNRARASGGECLPPKMPWAHRIKIFMTYFPGNFGTILDAKELRRGWTVYKNVCKTCHSLNFMYFRQMIGVFYSEDEVKEIALEFNTVDEDPGPTGDAVVRKCKPFDKIGGPYRNEQEARHSNSGALPPDLSLICMARKGGEDYVFALLNGYCDPPAGVEVSEGLHYNPYFPGTGIAMAQPVYNEQTEYEDINKDVKPYQSQLTKDVSVFLKWCGELNHDERNMQAVKATCWMIPAIFICWIWNKRLQVPMKNAIHIRTQDLRKFKK